MRRDGAQFRAACAEIGGAFVEKAEVAFDGQRIGAQQAPCHPVVDHGGHGVGHVVGLAVADIAGIGMDAQRQQAGHHMLGQGGFDLGDFDI